MLKLIKIPSDRWNQHPGSLTVISFFAISCYANLNSQMIQPHKGLGKHESGRCSISSLVGKRCLRYDSEVSKVNGGKQHVFISWKIYPEFEINNFVNIFIVPWCRWWWEFSVSVASLCSSFSFYCLAMMFLEGVFLYPGLIVCFPSPPLDLGSSGFSEGFG